MRTAPLVSAVVVVFGAALAASADEPYYNVTDVGTIDSVIVRVNNSGHVISNDRFDGSFIWKAGVRTAISRDFEARDLNDFDVVVGGLGSSSSQAAIWQDGVMTPLGQHQGARTWIRAINNDGRIVGENSDFQGFVRDPGDTGFTDLIPFWVRSSPSAVNISGVIAGYGTPDARPVAFKWTDGWFVTELPHYPSHASFAEDINDAGVIVGSVEHTTGNWVEAAVFEPGGLRGLGSLEPLQDSFALAVNEAGQIVGYGQRVTAPTGDRAMVWLDSGMYDLNNISDAAGFGWTLFTATDINEAGQIVGVGRYGGVAHAYLLTPGVPPACIVDLNSDGDVDFADYLEFLNLYDAQDPRVDFNEDGFIDFLDYLVFLNLYGAGC